MDSVKIGRLLPKFKIFDYILNANHWGYEIKRSDKCLGLGAHCLPCLPAAIKNSEFGCWIGTTIYDELQSQIGNFRFGRDVRERITLPIIKQYEKYTIRRASKIFSQSYYTKRRIIDIYGVPKSKIEVIPYPIDTEKFVQTNNSRNKEIVCVGRINDPRKNVDHLIRTFNQVLDEIPEATLTLVGDEPNKNIRLLIRELGIKESVKCVGEASDVVTYMDRASVFVLPSKQEGLGIVGLEAQSCGTPVIATRCGGPEDYIQNDINGFLVPQNNVDLLADRIIQILTDRDLRSRLGDSARANIVDSYSEEVVCEKISDGIKDLPYV
jgi:glycosyltransferase involved in cell wall biosynthesis